MKVELEARNLEQKGDAEKVAGKLDGHSIMVLRQAAETGQLYGSVSTRDLAALLTDGGFAVNRSQIALNAPIKLIGLHKVPVMLHPEVEVSITVTVARNADEAERIKRGEDVTVRREAAEDDEEAAAAAAAATAAEAFFEPEAVEAQRTREEAAEEPAAEAKSEAEQGGRVEARLIEDLRHFDLGRRRGWFRRRRRQLLGRSLGGAPRAALGRGGTGRLPWRRFGYHRLGRLGRRRLALPRDRSWRARHGSRGGAFGGSRRGGRLGRRHARRRRGIAHGIEIARERISRFPAVGVVLAHEIAEDVRTLVLREPLGGAVAA